MKTKQTLINSALLLGCASISSQVFATLPADPVLNISPAVPGGYYGYVFSGSYFAMDTNGDGAFAKSERTGLEQATDVVKSGLKLKTIQAAAGTHAGEPDGTESPGIDAAWNFFGNTGLHKTTTSTSVLSDNGTGNATIDMSGWAVTWNGIATIPMNSGASGTIGNPDGVGVLTCANDCRSTDTYTLDYSATVPAGDPSGFGGVSYALHLEGNISTFNTSPTATAVNAKALSSSVGGTASIINLVASSPGDPGAFDPNSANGSLNDGLTETNLDLTSLQAGTIALASGSGSCTTLSVTNNNDGTVTFPACTGTPATFTFTYSYADKFAARPSTATVTVAVSDNPPPNTISDSFTVNTNTATALNVLANDIDLGNDMNSASVAIVANASHGTTSINATTGVITYTSSAGFIGTDSFTYTVADGVPQASDAATATITVNALNAPASASATVAVGTTAVAAGSTDGVVTIEQIGIQDNNTNPEDKIAQSCIGGCFDFTLSGLANGGIGKIVLPLNTPIPVKADAGNTITYRKLINGTWKLFDRSGGDTFQSAPGTVTAAGVSCPDETSSDYRGLTTGDSCLLLSITDGGPNDDDVLANGTVVDPGGLAEITRVSGTDGCSMTGTSGNANDHADWWLLSAFIGLLGWFSLKRKQA